MDNLTKTSLIPQNNNKLFFIKIILLTKLNELRAAPVVTKYNRADYTFKNRKLSLSTYKLSLIYLQSLYATSNILSTDSMIWVFNSSTLSNNLVIIKNLITLYKSSWPLRNFNDSFLYNNRFKKLKFSNRLSTNTAEQLKSKAAFGKKRAPRKRNFFEKNRNKNNLRSFFKTIRFKKDKPTAYSTYFNKLNSYLRVTYAKLKTNNRGRFFFKNSTLNYRKPKLIKESKLFKGSTWVKTKKNVESSNLLINNIYSYKSAHRKGLTLANLNLLTLLGFNNWVNVWGHTSQLPTRRASTSKKQVKNTIAFTSRFLTNPSDSLLKLSMLTRLNNAEGRLSYLNHKSSLNLSAKRALIFFIKSLLNKSLSHSLSSKPKLLNKLIKSSLFNTILRSKNIKFSKKSLLFNLFIQNYLTSKWESRKLKKRYRKKKIFFRLKKLAVEITKSIFSKKYKEHYGQVNNAKLSKINTESNSYRFVYRFIFKSALKFLLKKSNIKVKYGKLRFMNLNSSTLKDAKQDYVRNNKLSNNTPLIKPELFSFDIRELVEQISSNLSITNLRDVKTTNTKKSSVRLLKRYLKNWINSRKYNKKAIRPGMGLLKNDSVYNLDNSCKPAIKKSRLKFVRSLRLAKLSKFRKRSKLKNLFFIKNNKSISARFIKYGSNSYKLHYSGRLVKRKTKKILLPTKLNKFSKGFFKKSVTKKKVFRKRRLPLFKPYINTEASNRSLFLNRLDAAQLSNSKADNLDVTTPNSLNSKNIKKSLYKFNCLKQKKLFLKKKKNYESNFLNYYTFQKSNIILHSNFLIKRTNPTNAVRVNSSKTSYIRDLYLKLPNRQINQELFKLTASGSKVESYRNYKNLIYNDYIYKNIINTRSSSKIDRFAIGCLRNNTGLPNKIFNKVLYIKKKTILFFRRRKLLDQYLRDLAVSRWSFKMSRLKRLAIIKLKSNKTLPYKPIQKDNNKPNKLISRITKLNTRLMKKKLNKNKTNLRRILAKKPKKFYKKSIKSRFLRKKRGLLKRFFIRSTYLRLCNLKKLKLNIKSLIKKDLSKSRKRMRREVLFQLPSYLKNTRLLAKLQRKRWVRTIELSRTDNVSKKFFRFRRNKKKHLVKKNRYRMGIPLFIQKNVSLILSNRFKRANSRLSTYNKIMLSLKKKKKTSKRRYTSLPFLSKLSARLSLINSNKINSVAIRKLAKCPIKIRGRTKKKYFLDTLNIVSRTDIKAPNVAYSSLYKLFKPYKKHSNWSSNNLLKKKIKKIKNSYLKTKKSSNLVFYTKSKKKKRLLNIKFLDSIRISMRNRFMKSVLAKFTLNKSSEGVTARSLKKQNNRIRSLGNSELSTSNSAWVSSVSSKNKLNRLLSLKKTKFKKTKFKKTKFKKTKFKKTKFKKTNFKRKNKFSIFKRYANNTIRLKIGRSLFRKFAIRHSIVDQLKFHSVNNMKKNHTYTSFSKLNSYDNIRSFYKSLLISSLSLYYKSINHNYLTLSKYTSSSINNLRAASVCPLSLIPNDSAILNNSNFDLKLNFDNIEDYKLKDSYCNMNTRVFNKLLAQQEYRLNSNALICIQVIKKNTNTVIKLNPEHSVKYSFTKFILRYLHLSKSTKRGNGNEYTNHILVNASNSVRLKDGLNNLPQCISNLGILQSSNTSVKKLTDMNYNSVRYNSFNHLFNLIANQIYNDNLLLLSVDLLKYSLSSSQQLNRLSLKISDNLKFEFSKIAPTFFIDEAVSLILTSIRFKDTNLFMTWFTRFMYKLPIKKHKRAIAFLSKLFRLIYFNNSKNLLHSTGIYFDIRGKIGVTGSKKKRHNSITLGKYSSTNKALRWVTQKGVVITSTGTLGVTFSIIY